MSNDYKPLPPRWKQSWCLDVRGGKRLRRRLSDNQIRQTFIFGRLETVKARRNQTRFLGKKTDKQDFRMVISIYCL
ncbi:hypothetical protein L596_030387 [Steinernema carpocapsae]|uniref:Uncharacterized protein n=1 Tax=Steinernema carpocapsae TaxID=34508 RepID=A0A4U5LP82_STECR|nr:hypothetical protein L596_030387 [Steinernema carpocapsae]